MAAAFRAGAAYFALVFALGFLLGALRQGMMGHGFGRSLLVAIEVPLILAFAWLACGWCAGRFGVPIAAGARVLMGAIMFVLLQAGELAVGVALMGGAVASHMARLGTAAGVMELLPQMLAALFPLISARLHGR
jgi:hypothetical protein